MGSVQGWHKGSLPRNCWPQQVPDTTFYHFELSSWQGRHVEIFAFSSMWFRSGVRKSWHPVSFAGWLSVPQCTISGTFGNRRTELAWKTPLCSLRTAPSCSVSLSIQRRGSLSRGQVVLAIMPFVVPVVERTGHPMSPKPTCATDRSCKPVEMDSGGCSQLEENLVAWLHSATTTINVWWPWRLEWNNTKLEAQGHPW